MKYINYICLTLVIIGAIYWGLIGLFDFNLFDKIFGAKAAISRIIYSVIGIAGLWSIMFYSKLNKADD